MLYCGRGALVLLLAMLAAALPAHAQKRVALVIGNSDYRHTGRLTNPKNDATDMAAALKKLGLVVVEGFDLDKAAFDRKVRDFAAALQGAEAGLFFFAGHGLQVAGHNYLVPVDAELKTASALDFEMVRLDVVQRVMEHETTTNILFLDACRDNPLARNLARALGTRSGEIGRGFAPVVSGVGTLISFSTQPGNVALDGTGRNSPFAGALAKRLAAPKEDLSAILIDVRNDVMQETQNKQVPWEHSAMRGRFYFSPVAPAASAGPPPAPARLSEAGEAWAVAERANTIPALEAFIRRFGDTYYGDLAKVRLATLQQAEAVKQAEVAKRKAEDEARTKVAVAVPPPVVKPDVAPAPMPGSSLERIATLKGHTELIRSVAFSPDGKHVLTASNDSTARLWDTQTGRQLTLLRGHRGPVAHASFSPDGRRIVTSSDDNTARIWDTQTGKEIGVLTGHRTSVGSASFSPDGKRVLTASVDSTARLWDAVTVKQIVALKHDNFVSSATFSHDGKRVMTASWDMTARLWDWATGKNIAVFRGHSHHVHVASISTSGRRVVTASQDGTARLWEAATGKEIAVLDLGRMNVNGIAAFSPDGKLILTASRSSDDETARLWDGETGREVATLKEHKRNISFASFTPNGKCVLTGASSMRVWDVGNGKEIATFDISNVASVSPDGRWIATNALTAADIWSLGPNLCDKR